MPLVLQSAPVRRAKGNPVYEVGLLAKRYDGGTGAAIFSGGIPIAPGRVTDVAQCSVWKDGAEVAATLTANGTHLDGSIKSIMVHVSSTVSGASTDRFYLRIGQAKTTGTVSAATINLAWITNPRLLACDDADYLCASRVAPLPLIPLANAAVPAGWYTWLTTDLDAWKTSAGSNAGTAEYDYHYVYVCRYLTTGAIDDLRLSMSLYVDTVVGKFDYWVPDSTWYTVDFNPEAITSDNTYGLPAEPHDRQDSALVLWYLTGWTYFRDVIVLCGGWKSTSPDMSATTLSIYGPRYDFRLNRGWLVNAYIGQFTTTFDCPLGFWSAAAATSYNTVLVTGVGGIIAEATQWAGSSWFYGLWGSSPDYTDATYDQAPSYMFTLMFPAMLKHYLHVAADSRIPSALAVASAKITDTLQGPTTSSVNSYDVYSQPYEMLDPATAGATTDGPLLAQMSCLAHAWKFAYDGDTGARDIADRLADVRHSLYTVDLAETPTIKNFGEIYNSAFHALAYRSGVAWNGWWR